MNSLTTTRTTFKNTSREGEQVKCSIVHIVGFCFQVAPWAGKSIEEEKEDWVMEGKEKTKQKTISEWLQNLHCGLCKCRVEKRHATERFWILLNCAKMDGTVNLCYMYFVIDKTFHTAPSEGFLMSGEAALEPAKCWEASPTCHASVVAVLALCYSKPQDSSPV